MFPLRFSVLASNHVLGWAHARADSAFYAAVRVYLEFLVADEILGEEAAEQPGVDAGPTASDEVACRLAVCDLLDISFQFRGSLFLLFFLLLRVVHVEEGQSEIRLWHDERERRVKLHAPGFQVVAQQVHRLANVVARRAQGVDIMAFGVHVEVFDKLAHDHGWPPAMHGEADAEPFALGEREVVLPRARQLGYEEQPVARCLGYCLGCPSRVAGIREV